jgi:hypothetical protein
MKRFLLLTTASFGLTLLFFNGPKVAQAQTTRTDTLRFMAATRGANFDGTGLKWCVSQTWHESYPGGPSDALDEVPETSAGYCPSLQTEQVELAVFGLTDMSSCTIFAPCRSLRVRIDSGQYQQGGCTYIEAGFFDYGTVNENGGKGNFRGRARMLHALGPSGYLITLSVTIDWYSGGDNWRTVGTVVNDTTCTKYPSGLPGFTDGKYHVHHDFMPPTGSVSCSLNTNTSTNFATGTTDLLRNDPNIWYIYSLTHKPGVSCLDPAPGPTAANALLDPAGPLDGDGNGAGTKSLATGTPSVTSPPTCITGTSWCGTMTVTPPVLQGAYSYYQGVSPADYFRRRQAQFPPPQVMAEWYNDGTYYFQVRNNGDTVTYPGDYYVGNCPYHANYGEPIYVVSYSSSALSCGFYGAGPPPYGAGVVGAGVSQLWAGFRGLNGANPYVPPTQPDSNTWAKTQIDSGHWWDVVKPALDAVIRAAANNMDMATLGITGNPPFDGDFGQVGMAGVMKEMNTLASRITRPSSSDWTRDEANRDWIGSARLRWSLTRKVSG